MPNTNKINALANDLKAKKEYKKITEKQWTVYYYLLSESCINTREHEKHRYIYRSSLNISAISRQLGIDRSTFYNALPKLKKEKLIEYEDGKDYILLPLPRIYTTLPKKLLTQLLAFRKKLSIDLLRTFLFLSATYILYPNKDITIRNIVNCLGHSDTTVENYQNIQIYIDLLSTWGLINYSTQMKDGGNIGKYRTYTILKVNFESKKLDDRFNNLESEMIAISELSEEEERTIAKYLMN